MKNNISLGKCGSKEININLEVLLKTRLLIQANSGGGKSWLLRRLAEQMFGKIPVIIIDPEGEFATLREKFGYVLVGKGGETPADLRSASMVAHKLLELRASAVCDLYEMKPQARHQWVRMFLDALIDAPKELWRPTVIIVDEAHQYAPEGKAGESDASSAMVDLATRGRKRGFCAIFATQRLGKLRKDAAAELLNVMVGMTFIDIDRERAAECLGVSREEKHKFNDEIKLLTEGNFYCLGRAITKERLLVKVGGVETTHPEAGGGKFAAAPPPAPEVVKAMMPKLADLPKAAEEKAKTEADLRFEIRSLKGQISAAKSAQPQTVKSETKIVPALTDAERKRLTKLIAEIETLSNKIEMANDNIASVVIFKNEQAKEIQFFKDLLAGKLLAQPQGSPSPGNRWSAPTKSVPSIHRPVPPISTTAESADASLGKCERSLLSVLAKYPEGCTRNKLILLAGYAWSGSTQNALGKLRAIGLAAGANNGTIKITETGMASGNFEPLPEGEAFINYWLTYPYFGKCERSLLRCLIDNPNGLTREELLSMSGYERSGSTQNALGALRTAGVIAGRNNETMSAAASFFE
jgi:hypothetical protein